MSKRNQKLEKYVTVTENWYPTINGKVRVAFVPLRDDKTPWRVCVWGGDDFGMERDFASKGDARSYYNLIQNGVTQGMLRSWGFQNA